MMKNQILSPTNSMKLKNVNAARRIKNGSPKLQEVLRQRCRQRMHERRNELFTSRRIGLINFSQEERDTLSDIVHEELENLASMDWVDTSEQRQSVISSSFPNDSNQILTINNEIFEITEEIEEQWIYEEYQKMLWEQNQMLSMFADDVVCPICLKCYLREIPNFVVCECGLKLPVKYNLQHLSQNIKEQVNAHSATCLDVPQFSIFQDVDNVSLCLSCQSCDFFALV